MHSEPWLEPIASAITSGQCRTALDVGANDGEWSLWLASRFERVVAVEPDDRCHNAATDHAVNIIEERCAVGAKIGFAVASSISRVGEKSSDPALFCARRLNVLDAATEGVPLIKPALEIVRPVGMAVSAVTVSGVEPISGSW